MNGTHESGTMGAECLHQSGMHVQEDAFILEIADPETGKLMPDGEKGTIYITTLYKYGFASSIVSARRISTRWKCASR